MKRLLLVGFVFVMASCHDNSKNNENIFCNKAGKCIEAEIFELSDKNANYSESVSSSSVIKDGGKVELEKSRELNKQIAEMNKSFDESFKEFDKRFEKAFNLDDFELSFPKISFPKIKMPVIKNIPFKNEMVYIDITPKNDLEVKILNNIREALGVNKNKIVETKEEAKAFLTGTILEKIKDFKEQKKYSLQVNLKITKGKNIVKTVVVNLLETGKDLESLKEKVLKNLNSKVYKQITGK